MLKPVEQLQSGDVLATPIVDFDGRLLLQKEVALTSRYIQRLREMRFSQVYVRDSHTNDIEMESTLNFEIQREVIGIIKGVYDAMFDPALSQDFVESGALGREFLDAFQRIFDATQESSSLIVNLSTIYSADAYLYTHCMNVGLMACVLGTAHGYSPSRVKRLGVGAMLHDIGKLRIRRHILDKPGPLTDDERREMERHTKLGYEMLSKQPDLSADSAICALLHHEKLDGTGYPYGLTGGKIHEFGRLLAVPDVYDAMTSTRVYHKPISPHVVLEHLYAHAGTHFELEFVTLLQRHVNPYPNGTHVILSNGCAGIVARANPENLQRPVILALSEWGQAVVPYEIELGKTLDVTIVDSGVADAGQVVP